MGAFSKLAKVAKEEAAKNSKYVRWESAEIEGNPIKGKYKPIKGKLVEVRDIKELTFKDQGRDVQRNAYPMVLEVDGDKKEFTASGRLVSALDEAGVEIGDTVLMERSGEGFDTNYSVKIIKE